MSTTIKMDFLRDKLKKNLEKSGLIILHGKSHLLDEKAFYFLTRNNKFRFACMWLTTWPIFENFIIFTIIINSLLLALFDYSDRESVTLRNKILNGFMFALSIVYIIEAALKIIARGFVVHSKAYLRDGWNILDFLVVVTSLVEMVGLGVSVRALRSLRAIRPLKSINAIPSMRRLVRTLMISLPNLGNVACLLSFIIILFGILGMH